MLHTNQLYHNSESTTTTTVRFDGVEREKNLTMRHFTDTRGTPPRPDISPYSKGIFGESL